VTNATITSWNGTLPTCEPVKCSPPKIGDNKTIIVTGCTGNLDGDTCQAKCGVGLRGQPTELKCKVDDKTGEFVGSAPQCSVVLCDPPPDVPSTVNASDCGGKKGMNAKCSLYCAYGYVGKPTSMTCKVKGDKGNWQGAYPMCEQIKCAPPAALNDTEFDESCNNLAHGEQCKASCRHKYIGKSTTLTCEVNRYDGKLSGHLPLCEPVLCDLPQGDEYKGVTFVDCHGLANGETCTAKCKEWRGYKGDDSQPECKVDEDNKGFFDNLPDCGIRKTYAGSHCYFPVWYKDWLMTDDCSMAEWHTEWCFIDPKTGYWGECDPKTKHSFALASKH